MIPTTKAFAGVATRAMSPKAVLPAAPTRQAVRGLSAQMSAPTRSGPASRI